jgi:hypothetical protein
MDTCLNVTYANSSNVSASANLRFELNTTHQKILNNLSVDIDDYGTTSKGIWNWWNLSDCTNRFELPWVYFVAICDDCVYDEDDFDNYNIITG